MATGRTSEPRTVTVTKTTGTPGLTAAAGTFSKNDIGRSISGTGIQAGTTLSAVASDTAATMSLNANASGAGAATIGAANAAHADAQAAGFTGWSPESTAEAGSYTSTAAGSGTVGPDRLTNPYTERLATRGRG